MFAHSTPYIWFCWHEIQAALPLITALTFAGAVYGRRAIEAVGRLISKS